MKAQAKVKSQSKEKDVKPSEKPSKSKAIMVALYTFFQIGPVEFYTHDKKTGYRKLGLFLAMCFFLLVAPSYFSLQKIKEINEFETQETTNADGTTNTTSFGGFIPYMRRNDMNLMKMVFLSILLGLICSIILGLWFLKDLPEVVENVLNEENDSPFEASKGKFNWTNPTWAKVQLPFLFIVSMFTISSWFISVLMAVAFAAALVQGSE